MSEHLRWYTKAMYSMDHVVRLVPADAWGNPSPCEGWTARHVLGHVIAVQRYTLAGLRGEQYDRGLLFDQTDLSAGDDPAATWAEIRDTMLEALDQPGVLETVVPSSSGPTTVDERIGFNIADTTVHSWDLARAAGVDDRLDPGLVERIATMIAPRIESMRGPMLFDPAVAVDAAADAQARLLALCGRNPSA